MDPAHAIAIVLLAMLGLGGGMLFTLDIHRAAAISLRCVVATFTVGASFYLRRGYTDLRLGLLVLIGSTVIYHR